MIAPPTDRARVGAQRHAAAGDLLRVRLEALARAYASGYLDSDPVGMVRRYRRPEDREIAGLLAAGLAYGRVVSIRHNLERLFSVIGPRPSRFVDRFDPRRDGRRFDGFVHRFTSGRDIAVLLWLVRQARERFGGLEAMMLANDRDPSSPSIGAALDAFGGSLFSGDARPILPGRDVPSHGGARWLLPLPSRGSACKRSCLFLRWMVRPDDGVDLGVWKQVPARRLVVPLDTHVGRVARAMGWTRRRSAGWAMAIEVTERLRRIDPEDPTRFDFALSRLGILGLLRAERGRLRRRDLESMLDARLAPAPVRGDP